jgi:hypothetical protein
MVRRGRRFESVRGICKSRANRLFFGRANLHGFQYAVGMEPFMEPSGFRSGLDIEQSLALVLDHLADAPQRPAPRERTGTDAKAER